MVCFSKDVKVPVKVRRTLSSVGTSSSNTVADTVGIDFLLLKPADVYAT